MLPVGFHGAAVPIHQCCLLVFMVQLSTSPHSIMGDSVEKKGSQSELQQFDSIFAELVDDVLSCPAVKGTDTASAAKWFREVWYM